MLLLGDAPSQPQRLYSRIRLYIEEQYHIVLHGIQCTQINTQRHRIGQKRYQQHFLCQITPAPLISPSWVKVRGKETEDSVRTQSCVVYQTKGKGLLYTSMHLVGVLYFLVLRNDLMSGIIYQQEPHQLVLYKFDFKQKNNCLLSRIPPLLDIFPKSTRPFEQS